MGLFGGNKKDLTYGGLPGTALVTSADNGSIFQSDESTNLADLGIGNYKLKFTLEVTLDDGRAPYTVTGKFKVPAKFGGNTGRGAKLPVYADPDDPNRLEINWDQFTAQEGVEGFNAPDRDKQRAMVHDATKPEMRAAMLRGWVNGTNGGHMSRADFDQAIKDAVTSGMLNAEEAAEATSQLTV